MSLSRTSILVLVLLLAACGGLPGAPRPVRVYDLGSTPAPAPEAVPVATVQVLAPSWLRSSAMQYRLSYASVSERHGYLESRWAAPPTELLQGFLGRSLGGGGACKLELELDEFIQDYVAPGRSDGVLEARARLHSAGVTLARRSFSLRLPAPGADAPGGVAALGRGAEQLRSELSNWLGGLAQEARIQEACARP
jgi:cholesterol transport system auxiliary component